MTLPDPVRALKSLLRVRRAEEKIVELYPQQEMRCPTHLSIGQEAPAVGVCEALRRDDVVYSTHRCHAHYIAKGGSLRAMFAELYGRVTGCSRGKGGSMHLVDPDVGMMGSSAIVGGTIPLAAGSAFSFQLDRADRVAVAFFGDAALEGGAAHESLGFAALRKLPVIFACENNGLATITPLSQRQVDSDLARRAADFGVPSVTIDGTDVEAVYRATAEAVARARTGGGPTLLVSTVCRWREHVGPNYDVSLGFRTQQELDAWMKKCPVEKYKAVVGAAVAAAAEAEVRAEVEDAVAFAKSSPYPDPEAMVEDVI